MSARHRARALADLRTRWEKCVRKALGDRHAPTWRGVDLRECKHEEYITKLGLELLFSHTKMARQNGRTPWEIANQAAMGEPTAAALWRLYTGAMKGARQLTWSRGLRDAAKLGDERTDQQIVDAENDATKEDHVASIPAAIWDEAAPRPGALIELLRAAERGGCLGVAITLGFYMWGLAPPAEGEAVDSVIVQLAREIAPSALASSHMQAV